MILNIAFSSQKVTLGDEEESRVKYIAFNVTMGQVDASMGGKKYEESKSWFI